ncbi:hypothetical protein DFQ01_103231 [Paenibacillus cellulosilyticus]|uniref:Uncharacterized protein n=1 Tax=Paenibacillus cellulosilyticus TaxID=375489 RepID=A0A2V2Z157_9BACL|nr:hypothetical protein [Paenibacillus cellulosilyticus]PWW06329.1 hypothetical protein DFQ01_103231 [Paenibacillus cellulosilyticus]QKS43330.1 hypothetical protein HUB94_00035 [Paenibacillus cellulosilyticus]QKS43492.1 hypothetical protein HUB94_02715 [Paenibacillus cellulosilyticus]
MVNRILTSDTYHDEVRARLGVGEDVLSNTTIDAPSILSISEAKVIASIPFYTELTGDDANFVYAAAVCMVAATLAPSMAARYTKLKKDFDFSIETHTVNWMQKAASLFDEAMELISLVAINGEGTNSPPVISASGPTRLKAMNRMR